jgi:hypothetical protein
LALIISIGSISIPATAQCDWTPEIPQKHNTQLHSLAITETICHPDIMILYDNTIKFPFASYAIHKQEQMTQLLGGRKEFVEDPLISPEKQHLVNDTVFHYPYSRGHLTPSYIMSYNKSAGGSWEQTYFISNILPQTAKLNEGQWEKLEMNIVDELAKQPAGTSWEIYTGGFWNGKYSIYPTKLNGQNDIVKDYLFWKAFCNRQTCLSGMITAFHHEDTIKWNVHSVNSLIPGLFPKCCPDNTKLDIWETLLNGVVDYPAFDTDNIIERIIT